MGVALAAALAAALSAGARAGRPLVSETADAIGAGDCELEAAAGQRREIGAPWSAMPTWVGCAPGATC